MNQKLRKIFYQSANNIFGKMSKFRFRCSVNINQPIYKPGEYQNFMADSLSKEIAGIALKYLNVDKVETNKV